MKESLLCVLGLGCFCMTQGCEQEVMKPNVVFICVDDLRPTLGCYADNLAKSPNIDKLAKQGVVFNYAYCQQAVCNPSRASMLTGLRPDQIGVTNLETHFRESAPDVLTLPQVFGKNGYKTMSIGKIFHGQKNTQDDISWTKKPLMNLSKKQDEYFLTDNNKGVKAASYEWADVADSIYEDGRIAELTVRELKDLAKSDNPFFLAVGFKKPHLPFCAPKKYWDLYEEAIFNTAAHKEGPFNAPEVAFHNSQELRGYSDIPKNGEVETDKAQKLWHGYYACVSYVDEQVGKIMEALEKHGLRENTIVVLWGDHGYHLGEHTLWCKSTNFELDARIPLIISALGQSKTNVKSNSLAEAVDIYPTLLDLCGLKSDSELAGSSLKPVLLNPSARVKDMAFSQFVRPYGALRNNPPTYMGYSMRTDEWRCTAWFNLQTDSIEFTELYNMTESLIEKHNYVSDQKYEKIQAELTSLLRKYKDKDYSSVFNNNYVEDSKEQCGDSVYRVGVSLRTDGDDNVHTFRIPGLTTTNMGTLLAIYDVRRESSRDLQGHMDIGLSRSTDGGNSWEPMCIVLDMGTWGGLPEKFNGVSDACILVDKNTNTIFVAGLWMHGVINSDGQWVEGLTETSTEWNHQWRNKGSQPGFGVKETSQFLITKSVDDGKTWSEPVNLTRMCKKEEWWLWAPAPGHGITLDDGTLVFPTQGRDENGKSFSNITWSNDSGEIWHSSNPAYLNTTECMAVQLYDGSVMLNMRHNDNRNNTSENNGRAVAVTSDLGKTWIEHPSSRNALVEPTCMGSLHKHEYTENGQKRSILLFSNPNSKTTRHNMTIKVSFDDGATWPEKYWLLLDEGKSRGYSCLTSVDEQAIGILYEGSAADLVFHKIDLSKLIDK